MNKFCDGRHMDGLSTRMRGQAGEQRTSQMLPRSAKFEILHCGAVKKPWRRQHDRRSWAVRRWGDPLVHRRPSAQRVGGHVRGRRKAVGSVPADGFANSGERRACRNGHSIPRLGECERSRLSQAISGAGKQARIAQDGSVLARACGTSH